jgi:hypothetical protein
MMHNSAGKKNTGARHPDEILLKEGSKAAFHRVNTRPARILK